jgi:hypothetical protein
MTDINWNPTLKQMEAIDYLMDNKTTEIFFGGGAGGGKSYLGCVWCILNCLKYPGIRGLMGRAILKTLKESTLLTFFSVCRDFGLNSNEHYKYNAITGLITFWNGSEIYLKDLFAYPSDPEFDELGSTEYSFAFIDEASQVSHKAYQIVMSRLRYKLNEFGIIPKLLTCSNPTKNFLYGEFYKPWKENNLIEYRKFVQALVGDNKYISPFYKENLQKLDRNTKERLLYGNFEYDDDPTKLFNYDAIMDLFTNEAKRGTLYCTVDVAGRGRDRTVIIIWDGLFIKEIIMKDNISNVEMDEILTKNQIPRSKCVIDNDGVGFGLVKDMPGVKGFVNNSSPIQKKKENEKDRVLHNYANLKAQCWFELSNYVNSGLIGIYRGINVDTKKLIIEDLEQIKQKDPGKDQPLRIITKEDIKEVLGRSTDCGDAIMMRMYFEVKPPIAYDFIKPGKPDKSKEQIEKEKKERQEETEEVQKQIKEGRISFGPTTKGKKRVLDQVLNQVPDKQ